MHNILDNGAAHCFTDREGVNYLYVSDSSELFKINSPTFNYLNKDDDEIINSIEPEIINKIQAIEKSHLEYSIKPNLFINVEKLTKDTLNVVIGEINHSYNSYNKIYLKLEYNQHRPDLLMYISEWLSNHERLKIVLNINIRYLKILQKKKQKLTDINKHSQLNFHIHIYAFPEDIKTSSMKKVSLKFNPKKLVNNEYSIEQINNYLFESKQFENVKKSILSGKKIRRSDVLFINSRQEKIKGNNKNYMTSWAKNIINSHYLYDAFAPHPVYCFGKTKYSDLIEKNIVRIFVNSLKSATLVSSSVDFEKKIRNLIHKVKFLNP